MATFLQHASKEQLTELISELIIVIQNTSEDEYLREVVSSLDDTADLQTVTTLLREYNRGDEP
jgi:hypothetical protein